jgi:hypothetical protein
LTVQAHDGQDSNLQLAAWLTWACAGAGLPLPPALMRAVLEQAAHSHRAVLAAANSRAGSSKRARRAAAAHGTAMLAAAVQRGAVIVSALAGGLAVQLPAGAPGALGMEFAQAANAAVAVAAEACCAAHTACRKVAFLQQAATAWLALSRAVQTGDAAPAPALPIASLLTAQARTKCQHAAQTASNRLQQLNTWRRGMQSLKESLQLYN